MFLLVGRRGEGGDVVLGPGAEGVGGAAEQVGDRGGDEGGLAESGGPGVEEHVDRVDSTIEAIGLLVAGKSSCNI